MLTVLLVVAFVQAPATETQPAIAASSSMAPAKQPGAIRVATFNIKELSAAKIHACDAEGRGNDPQLRSAAAIIQRVRPDVLLINEIDFDESTRTNAKRFASLYLNVPQGDQKPIDYAHIFFAPVNTGLPTGLDLNNDGKSDGPDDAYGFGKYPGQYGMALLSRFPIDEKAARTFQLLPWRAMPGNLLPDGSGNSPAFYSPDEAAKLRLSSKSHWDLPVEVHGKALHLLISHPTPPVFDGPEDRNGRRNFDEIRFWIDYINGGSNAEYIIDDQHRSGGLPANVEFIVMGDLNADPALQNADYGRPAISQLLEHPRVQDPLPHSQGGAANKPDRVYRGELKLRTADFGRADFILPSRELKIKESGIFWPLPDAPEAALVYGKGAASDHRLVWVDLELPGR